MPDQHFVVSADKSIVVLPFANLSPAPEHEYLSDGITDALTGDLGRVGRIEVASRASAMTYKGTDKDPHTIARELKVRFVLEGSVRKSGTSLRITAQLVDGRADAKLWSDQYAGVSDQVLELTERVAREVIHALDVSLTTDEDRALSARPIADPMAYDCYLRALHELARPHPAAIERAETLVKRGLEIAIDNPLLMDCLDRVKAERRRLA